MIYQIKCVGFQGVRGAFSHQVAKAHFPDHELIAIESFDQVVDEVEAGKIDIGIIPLENSYAGRVAEVHNIFPRTSAKIVGEVILPIEHNLLVLPGVSAQDITEISSHPQALMQCRENITKHFPNVILEKVSNTAVAAQVLAEEKLKNKAVIASKIAAEEYSLSTLIPSFQDAKDNCTTFVLLAREMIPDFKLENSANQMLTTIIFTTPNAPFSLYKSLKCFADHHIDIIKIESYIPSGGVSQRAQFYLSFYGDMFIEESNANLAIEALHEHTKLPIKIIGCYRCDKKRINSGY